MSFIEVDSLPPMEKSYRSSDQWYCDCFPEAKTIQEAQAIFQQRYSHYPIWSVQWFRYQSKFYFQMNYDAS